MKKPYVVPSELTMLITMTTQTHAGHVSCDLECLDGAVIGSIVEESFRASLAEGADLRELVMMIRFKG